MMRYGQERLQQRESSDDHERPSRVPIHKRGVQREEQNKSVNDRFESFQTKLKRVFLDHLEQEVLASLNREEERVLQTDQER